MDNSSNCGNTYEEEDFNRKSGWLYAVVIESTIETRWTFDELFYRNPDKINLSLTISERINESYSFQTNNLRTYVPKPFRFKDDPNLNKYYCYFRTKIKWRLLR